MEAKVLILLSILLIVGIYVLPSAMARIAGTHTFELNSTGGAANLVCTTCHGYVYNELSSTQESNAVLTAHRNAAGNTTYTSTLLNPNVTNTTNSKLCLMCHLTKFKISASHTQIIIRPCIDPSCHGTNESTNNTIYEKAGKMGPALGNVSNVHENWFDQQSSFISPLLNETGSNYSRGYFVCIGCHTAVGFEIHYNESTPEYFAHDNLNAFGGKARRYL